MMTEITTTTPIVVNVTDPTTIDIGIGNLPSPMAVDQLTRELCDYSDSGMPIGFNGKKWSNIFCVKIRTACNRLNVKGHKNLQNGDMTDLNISTYKNKNAYELLNQDAATNLQSTRKEVQCPYRLMNILFSDEFPHDFSKIGNNASQQDLDTAKAANNEGCWKRISIAFMDNSIGDFGCFKFKYDDVFVFENIDRSKIVQQDWRKLRAMWKSVNAEYKASLIRFTQSGSHDDNFYGYSSGKKDVYYLRLVLDLKPNLNDN
jgi:hypothetical protein